MNKTHAEDINDDYCPVCHYPYDEDGICMCASTCPCGCNNDPRLICTYDHMNYCEHAEFLPSVDNSERCAICGHIRRPATSTPEESISTFRIENKRGICQYCGHPKKEHTNPIFNWYKMKTLMGCDHSGCECCAYQPTSNKTPAGELPTTRLRA